MSPNLSSATDSVQIIESRPTPKRQEGRERFEALALEVSDQLKAYDIPEEKEQSIVNYAVNILIKHPDMKPARIARKTVEYFKLKRKV